MTDQELMVMGCLTLGPLSGDELRYMLCTHPRRQTEAAIARALKSLHADERIVMLDSGRWALIHRT